MPRTANPEARSGGRASKRRCSVRERRCEESGEAGRCEERAGEEPEGR